ncbi:MAG TPA: FAD-dependent oxidoreductase [Ktedonobacteraceae bacterium]|nr:FAD-dependent oxidoreductase [Ktedonobacteraceae bacterium]
MAAYEYDLLVIGAGAAGSTAATTAADNGKRVALVERDKIGGTCLNYGCDPTKTMLHIANLLYHARHADQFGIHHLDAKVEWPAVMARVHQVIDRIRGGTSEEAAKELTRKGIDVLVGEAVFVSPHELTIAGKLVSAARIIIASGCQNIVPVIEGLNEVGFISNVEAVSLPALPRSLAIVGGGAIGIEFAQMFRRFGVDVTVLEHSSTILDKEDHEVAEALCKLLVDEGIRMETDVELQRAQRDPHGKRLMMRCGDRQEEQLVVDEILLAIGRRPSLEPLQLEKAGVNTSKRGIYVDATLRTNVSHIWAAGDVTGAYQFTHVAYEQGKLAANNAFAKEPLPFDDRVIPWVTYTDPSLAHVGKTEEQLRNEQAAYQVTRMYFKDVERAVAEGATSGLVKLLVDKQGLLLGGHVLAPHAGDLLAPIILSMRTGITAEMLASTIMPYPTMVEGVRWAADRL